MKITEVSVLPAADEFDDIHLIVKVETDEGIYGLGESGIRRWGDTTAKAIEHLSGEVVGRCPMATEAIWQNLYRGGFQPADRVYSCALSAIDMALWDIKGKALGQPVYALLGGPVRDKVVTYAHLRSKKLGEQVAEAKDLVEAGWKYLRFGLLGYGDQSERGGLRETFEPRKAIRDGVEHMARLRQALGDEPEICIDVHTRLDLAHAIVFCREAQRMSKRDLADNESALRAITALKQDYDVVISRFNIDERTTRTAAGGSFTVEQ